MKNIVLTTDSGLRPRKELNPIIIDDQITDSNGNVYKDDDIDITTKQILENRNNDNITYKTSGPLLIDYITTFKKYLDKGYDIIHLSLSGGLSSSSINNANMIAKELNSEYKDNKVYIVDSKTGATGGTLYYELAYQALMNSNMPIDKLIEELENIRNSLVVSYYMPDPIGFITSGRDKSNKYDFAKKVLTMSSSVLKMLSMKYRIDFHDNGDLYLKNIFKATKETGMLKMTKEIVNDKTIANYDDNICVIGNLNQKYIDMNKLKEYLESFNYFKNIYEQPIGNIIAAYGCDDLCGIALVKKKTK